MNDALRTILEIGKGRRVVAAAMDWPGLERWGTSEEEAMATLRTYFSRYAGHRAAVKVPSPNEHLHQEIGPSSRAYLSSPHRS